MGQEGIDLLQYTVGRVHETPVHQSPLHTHVNVIPVCSDEVSTTVGTQGEELRSVFSIFLTKRDQSVGAELHSNNGNNSSQTAFDTSAANIKTRRL